MFCRAHSNLLSLSAFKPENSIQMAGRNADFSKGRCSKCIIGTMDVVFGEIDR